MNELISELVGYGIEKGLVEEDDKIYVINRLLELFRLDSYTQTEKHQTRAADTPTPTISLHHSLPYRHIHALAAITSPVISPVISNTLS